MNARFDSVNAIRDSGMIRTIREVVVNSVEAQVVSRPYGDVRQNDAGKCYVTDWNSRRSRFIGYLNRFQPNQVPLIHKHVVA